MVTRKTMTINRFVPGARQITQQQPSGLWSDAPCSSPSSIFIKSIPKKATYRRVDPCQSEKCPSQESLPAIKRCHHPGTIGSGWNELASSSRAALAWQPTFQLDGKPFLASASVRVWEKCEGVMLLKAWCTTSFCSRTCTPLRRGQKNP